MYTKALELSPNNVKVLNNRATAYKKLKMFDKMYDDSLAFIENDDTNFKAYLKNGEACLELCKNNEIMDMQLCDKGLKRLMKALSIIEHIPQGDPLYASK